MASKTGVSLKTLTEDDKLKAFEKTRQQYESPGIKLVLITEEYYQRALDLCRDYFVPLEPINKALGLQYTQDVEDVWMDALKLHLSLMFVDENTGDPIAFRTTNIVYKDEAFEPARIKDDAFREVMSFIIRCEEKSGFFEHFNTTEAFNFLGLVVAEKYMRRGFASKIFFASIDMIRNFGFDEVFVKGGGTSNFSKKIYEKSGFESLYEGFYDKYEVNGEFPIQDTGEHKSMIIYGLKVTQNDQIKK